MTIDPGQTISKAKHSSQRPSLNLLTIEPHTLSSNTMAKWFEEKTGIIVNVFPVSYADITEKATQDVISGTGAYDVIQYWYPMLGSLVEKNILLDITGWWNQNAAVFDAADFIPVFGNTWCLEGNRRYGIPHDGDMHLLFYNTSLFKKYDLKPPETWDDYLEISKVITLGEKGNGIFGCGIMCAKIPLILIGTFLNRLAGFGGSFFDAEGTPSINSVESVAALEHLLAELPFAVPDPISVAFDEMLGPWLSGRVGMVEFWADLGKMSDNPEQSVIPHQWGVAPLPKGPGSAGKVAAPLNAGWSLGLSTRSKNQDLALQYLKFVLDPEVHLRICTINGGLDPVRWSTYDQNLYRKFVTGPLADAARAAVTSAAVAWPTTAKWPELQEVLHENLVSAITQLKKPRQALDDTQEAWKKIVRR
jgi:multiple sugar transport system substrate-binding protein